MKDQTGIKWHQLLDYVAQKATKLKSPACIDEYKKELLEKLKSYHSNEQDFESFILFNGDEITMNLVEEYGDICNIMVICWPPGAISTMHSHNGSKCFVKILKGQLIEHQFTCPSANNPLVKVDLINEQGVLLSQNNVTNIDDSIGAHRMTNKSSTEPAISLHIYWPPYRITKVYTNTNTSDPNGPTKLSIDQCKLVDLTFYNRTKTAK